MNNYVFEFEINGDLDLKLDNPKYIELLSIENILELSNSHCMSVKAVGTRNDDRSIKYFKEDEII